MFWRFLDGIKSLGYLASSGYVSQVSFGVFMGELTEAIQKHSDGAVTELANGQTAAVATAVSHLLVGLTSVAFGVSTLKAWTRKLRPHDAVADATISEMIKATDATLARASLTRSEYEALKTSCRDQSDRRSCAAKKECAWLNSECKVKRSVKDLRAPLEKEFHRFRSRKRRQEGGVQEGGDGPARMRGFSPWSYD